MLVRSSGEHAAQNCGSAASGRPALCIVGRQGDGITDGDRRNGIAQQRLAECSGHAL